MTIDWRDVLLREFGVRAELQRLDGEHDLNFSATADDGANFILKVMRQGCDPAFVDMQIQAMTRINDRAPDCPVPHTVPAASGARFVSARDAAGADRLLWLQDRHDGVPYALFSPKTPDLVEAIGRQLAKTDLALAGFDHPQLTRPLLWNLIASDWVTGDVSLIADLQDRKIIADVIEAFAAVKPAVQALPHQDIHNDLNDYNILVRPSLTGGPSVSAIIDFGDMTSAPRICNLAIAGAYIVLDHDQADTALAALVRGYHAISPLTPDELDIVVALLRMRLAVSIIISTRRALDIPDDPYVTISQAPAWRFLRGPGLDLHMTKVRLRAACALPVTEATPRVLAFLDAARGGFAALVGAELASASVSDLSVEGSAIPQNPFATTTDEARRALTDTPGGEVRLGRYGEPRLVYTSPDFYLGRWKGSDRRTVHLGIDIFAPAGTDLHAPMAA
ncbi:MAG: phosphotransferase, partial [Alphaproteobacteria bacterium]